MDDHIIEEVIRVVHRDTLAIETCQADLLPRVLSAHNVSNDQEALDRAHMAKLWSPNSMSALVASAVAGNRKILGQRIRRHHGAA